MFVHDSLSTLENDKEVGRFQVKSIAPEGQSQCRRCRVPMASRCLGGSSMVGPQSKISIAGTEGQTDSSKRGDGQTRMANIGTSSLV